jgi:hypothetical protein
VKSGGRFGFLKIFEDFDFFDFKKTNAIHSDILRYRSALCAIEEDLDSKKSAR